MEHDNSSLVELLPEFFRQWPKNMEWAREKDKKTNIDASQLTEFFSLISEPLKVVQHRALSFEPWEVAGLGRKEVRNTAVLAWLLDPEGTHGFGRLSLQALLQAIRHRFN
ncbi:PDDEXK-like family protein, partial [Enterobacter cloacae]|uniref:PD-(D/E)XK nuclease family protein n=1 Tax=Enterobacter cloacae TaxID=550 RepID=UPI00063AC56F